MLQLAEKPNKQYDYEPTPPVTAQEVAAMAVASSVSYNEGKKQHDTDDGDVIIRGED